MSLYNIVNPASLQPGQPEDVSQVLANFQAIQAVLNGGIDDVNIRSTAAIQISKLNGYPSDITKSPRGDGAWGSRIPTRQVLSTTGGGTYTTPAGCIAILVECIGAGGGSAPMLINPTNAGVGGGGGGGAYAASFITNPAATYAYNVAPGGGAAVSTAAGLTSFGSSLVVAAGGSSGVIVASTGYATAGAGAGGSVASSTGQLTIAGSDGEIGVCTGATSIVSFGNGGAAARGGGTTRCGLSNPAAGITGKFPGGGASACWVTTSGNPAGAIGAQGLIVVTEYY